MTPEPSQRDTLLQRIIDLEWAMFHAVKASEPTACQEEEATFRLMRWMSHAIHQDDLLQALAANLERAAAQGRNLMTEKYARMAGQIPPLQSSPFIPQIVAAETGWMQALARRYPLTFPGAGGRFQAYLAADLETWSGEALRLYAHAVLRALGEDRNLVAERYLKLFARLGYASLEAREQKARMDLFKCAQ